MLKHWSEELVAKLPGALHLIIGVQIKNRVTTGLCHDYTFFLDLGLLFTNVSCSYISSNIPEESLACYICYILFLYIYLNSHKGSWTCPQHFLQTANMREFLFFK